MLLAVDIGNSSTKFGVFDGVRLKTKLSIPTKRDHTPTEIKERVGDTITASVDAAIACSVVPEVEAAVAGFASHFLQTEMRFVTSSDDLGLKFDFPVDRTGTDRLVNSFAAIEKYGGPCVVVSFGTATTFDVVDRECRYLGGCIAPGMAVNAKALAQATSKLPEVEICKPENVIAQTTEGAILSGIVLGHVAMAEGLLQRIIKELDDKPCVIATGGFARFIAPDLGLIDHVDEDLTLEGLAMLHKNSAS